MKQIFLFTILVLATQFVSAQSYNTSAGVRLGNGYGFTVNQRILDHTTVEGILQNSSKDGRFLVTGMVKQHFPILIKRFNIYAGAGLHKGWETDKDSTFDNPFGLTGVLGAEFTIARVNLSYDFKPVLSLGSNVAESLDVQSAISVRYVFVKRPLLKDKDKRQKDRAKKKKKKQKKKGGKESILDKIKDTLEQ